MKISKLLVAITFHFVEDRLKYLEEAALQFDELAETVRVIVITNESDPTCHEKIRSRIPESIRVEIFVPKFLGHPYLLTWSHLDLFREYYKSCEEISHFLYIEDDILVRKENIEYWLKGREALSSLGIIPSFLRYEIPAGSSVKVSTDITARVRFSWIPRVRISSSYYYANLPQPYQGMYLLDRALAGVHLFGPSSNPDFGRWSIREKAAQGVTFLEVPDGCFSRNFVGVDVLKKSIDPGALIHHLPNNYADRPDTSFGKIPIEKILIFSPFFAMFERKSRSKKIRKAPRVYVFYESILRGLIRRVLHKTKFKSY